MPGVNGELRGVILVHDCLDEDHAVVRGCERGLQFGRGLHDECLRARPAGTGGAAYIDSRDRDRAKGRK